MTQPSRCAAVYARVSTDKQSHLSTADQVRKCRDDAPNRKLTILHDHIYVDEAMSGVGSDRPAFQRMMSAALSPERPFDAILVDDTSRLSRNTEEALGIFRKLNFAGIQLIAVSQGIDSNDDQADVLVTVHGMVDSLYVKELAKKTHRGLEGLILRGLHAGGRCYGYDTVSVGEGSSKRLVVNESQAAIVRRIFEMSGKGIALKKIAAILNAEKLTPPRPRKGRRASWCPTGIREMLRRELYVGRVIWNRSKFVKAPGTNRRLRRPRPESEWRIMEQPQLQIINDELWESVRARLGALKTAYPGHGRGGGWLSRSATSPYLFSGILKCADCGGNLVIVNGHGYGRHTRYGCSQHFNRATCGNGLTERQSLIEARLLFDFQDQILRPEVIDFALDEFGRQLKEALSNLSGELGRMRNRKARIEFELRNLSDRIASGDDFASLRQAMTERERELRGITERLLSCGHGSVDSGLKDIREFVTSRITDLRGLLAKDVTLARAELTKHVQEIRMTPTKDSGRGHYVAEGEWDLLGTGSRLGLDSQPADGRFRMVAGVGFEPTTSGL